MRIASRKSRLALWQAGHVARLLGCKCTIMKITTTGDKITDVPLSQVGGKGFFVKEVDMAVATGKADIAVHSMKDMPTQAHPGLVIGAVPRRAAPYEALMSAHRSIAQIPLGGTIATSSIRRIAEIARKRPDLKVVPLRGNVDTRVERSKQFDAVILAEAGLTRLGFCDFSRVRPDIIMPAACQGALGVVAREDDTDVLESLAAIDHLPTRIEIEAERAFMIKIEGGCQVPAGALARFRKGYLTIRAFIGSLDGTLSIRGGDRGSVKGPVEARRIGTRLGEKLLRAGGAEILAGLARRPV